MLTIINNKEKAYQNWNSQNICICLFVPRWTVVFSGSISSDITQPFFLKVFGGEPLSSAVTQVQVANIHRLALARFNAVLVSNERIKVVFNGSLNANLLVNGWLDWLGRFGRCRRRRSCCFYNLRRTSFKRLSFRAKFSWTPRFSQEERRIRYNTVWHPVYRTISYKQDQLPWAAAEKFLISEKYHPPRSDANISASAKGFLWSTP